MQFLSASDIAQLVSMREVITLMRQLFVEIGRGSVPLTGRSAIVLRDGKDKVLFMPGHISSMNSVGIKVVSVFPDNPTKHGRSTTNAVVMLHDAETGEAIALMDGGHITALRTAAVSAVATDILAKPDARTLGVFGAGVQARSHIDAIMMVRPIASIDVFDPNHERAQQFVDALRLAIGPDCALSASTSAESTASGKDIVVTATTSDSPVFDGRWLAPGTHINAIGAFRPDAREVDDHTVVGARIYVDSRAEALADAGDLIIPLEAGTISSEAVLADLGELSLAPEKGRQSPCDITLFKSVGLAVEDIVVARLISEKAAAEGVGAVL